MADEFDVAVNIKSSPSQIILLNVGELFEVRVTGGEDPTPAPIVIVTVLEKYIELVGEQLTELTVAVISLLNSWTPSPIEANGLKLLLLALATTPQVAGSVLFSHE